MPFSIYMIAIYDGNRRIGPLYHYQLLENNCVIWLSLSLFVFVFFTSSYCFLQHYLSARRPLIDLTLCRYFCFSLTWLHSANQPTWRESALPYLWQLSICRLLCKQNHWERKGLYGSWICKGTSIIVLRRGSKGTLWDWFWSLLMAKVRAPICS